MRRMLVLLVSLSPLLLAGCGADPNQDGPTDEELRPAAAVRGSFRDFAAVQLSNGLVTVQVVPKLGGRALGYEFDGKPLIYSNPKLFGQLPGDEGGRHEPWAPGTAAAAAPGSEPAATAEPTDGGLAPVESAPAQEQPTPPEEEVPGGGVEGAEPAPSGGESAPDASASTGPMPEAEEVGEIVDTATIAAEEPLRYVASPTERGYTNYGGAAAVPAPRSGWSRSWPPPVPLDLGEFAETVDTTEGELTGIALESPKDEELGLQMGRRLSLLRASTVLRVEHWLKNIGATLRPWSINDRSQHPGALSLGETFTRDAQVFLPLAEASPHHLGFAALIGPQASDQYHPADGVLRVEYLGQEAMVGGDSRLGWMAFYDRRNELVLVKVAELAENAPYPDGNLTTTVYTSPSASESYLELCLRSPMRELPPGEELRFSVDYGAARCPAPIVRASRVGCVSTRLKAERTGDSVLLTGVFGVFYAGTAQVVFYDTQGEPLARTQPIAVSPRQPFKLDTVAPLPERAVRAALVITNHQRVDVGELDDSGILEMAARTGEQVAAPAVDSPAAPVASVPDVDLTAEGGPAPAGGPTVPDAGEVPGRSVPSAPEPIHAPPVGP